MNGFRGSRSLVLLAMGAMLLQTGGCTITEFNNFLQTVLLGITAAGAVAILRNI